MNGEATRLWALARLTIRPLPCRFMIGTAAPAALVYVGSGAAHQAYPGNAAYVAAKHGLAGLTKTVALEVAQSGVTCNAISPGYVRTPLVENQIADTAKARGISEEQVMKDVLLAAQPTRRFVEYDQLAGLLLYLVSDAGGSANGANFAVDGGWTAQ